MSIEPTNSMEFNRFGLFLKGIGELAKAEEVYKSAIKKYPNSSQFYFYLAQILEELRRDEESELMYIKTI